MAPTATFVHEGDVIDYTPVADVSAGDVIVLNDLVAIAKKDIEADELGALAVKGVFEMPKDIGTGTDLSAGEDVYWNDTSEIVEAESSGNVYLGKVELDAGVDDETVRVVLAQRGLNA